MQVKKSLESLTLRSLIVAGGLLDEENRDVFVANRLGGSYIIRNILESRGIQSEVVDMVHNWPTEWLEKYLKDYSNKHWVNIVCISATFMTSDYVRYISGLLKKYFPRAVIILGSGNPGLESNHYVNYHVYSYGENAIFPVLENYFLGTDLKYEMRGRTKFVNALHDYPAWPKEDYSLAYKDSDCVNEHTVGTFEMSRGCRFKCSFCNWPILGIKEDTSQKDIQKQVDALQSNYEKYGMTEYFVADDTFNDRTSKLEKLANIVSKLDFKPNFSAFMRLDLLWALREQWELLEPARLLSHHYGLETFNLETAKIIGKGKQAEIGKETLLELQDYLGDNYTGYATLIVGLPKESKESILETQEWLNNNWTSGLWNWYNLDIHKQGEVLSAFGADMAKYNYKILPGRVPTGLSKAWSDGAVYWQNEHMDAGEAYKLARQLNHTRRRTVHNAWMVRNRGIDQKDLLEKYVRKKFDILYNV